MSVIQDALKKAHGEYVEKKTPFLEEAARPAIITRAPQKIKSSTSIRLPVLIGILTIVLLVYSLKLSLQYSRTQDKTISASATSEPAASPPAVQKPAPSNLPGIGKENAALPQLPKFALSGIMYVENKPQAIINGCVLEEGDKINGATVMIIEKDCVLLDINDADLKLELGKQN